MGLLISLGGMLMSFMFAQTARHMTVGPISATAWALTIPIMISLLWNTATRVGWWTVAAFIGLSIAAGVINGLLLRRGRALLYNAQPLQAILMIGAAVGCWFL